jgi:hypothetical protein
MLMNGSANLILRSGLLAASRRMDHKRLLPSFETPRKCAAPQDEGGGYAAGVTIRPSLQTLFRGHRLHRQPRILDQRHVGQPFAEDGEHLRMTAVLV